MYLNTAKVCRVLCKDRDKNHIFSREKSIQAILYCTGYSTCSLYGRPCPQQDDTAGIISKMLAADVIVLGTPVYFYAMSAQVKAFLDRYCGLYTEMRNKEFYFSFLLQRVKKDEGIWNGYLIT